MGYMTVPEIKADLEGKLNVGMQKVGDLMYEAMDEFINVFYCEYIPKSYPRTDTLGGSLNSPTISGGGLRYTAEIHFNPVSYIGAGIPDQAIEAMNLVGGTHGGYAGGTAIFIEGDTIIGSNARAWVMSALG